MSPKNKLLFLVLLVSVAFSGCTEDKSSISEPMQSSVTPEPSVTIEPIAAPEVSHEEKINLSSADLSRLSEEENIPEISLISFSSIYIRDNPNKNPEPIFNWDNVPGNESYKLRDYLKKWGPNYGWVEYAQITKTNGFLFNWDRIPGEGSIQLIEILLRNYGIIWIPQEKIEKSDDGRAINVSIGNSNISFRLNNEKTGAIMAINDGRTEELIVKNESGRLNIYDGKNRTIRIGSSIEINLISNKSAFMKLGDGGIEFPVKEENGTFVVLDVNNLNSHDISERQYVVYNLSIKNNGSGTLNLKPYKLHLRIGNRIFNPVVMGSNAGNWLLFLSEGINENKIEDIVLSPGQVINGDVAFNVNSMYDKSFLLMYNVTPVAMASFEKSINALTRAELFDYTEAIGKRPYYFGNKDSYILPEDDYFPETSSYPSVWTNWMNRSVFENYRRLDIDELNSIHTDNDLPVTSTAYVLKVVPERNITMYPGNPFRVVDDKGEEIINRSYYDGMAVLKNQTYKRYSMNYEQKMDISNATVVRIFFDNIYGWPMASRMNRNDQTIILDNKQNIVAVIYSYAHFVT